VVVAFEAPPATFLTLFFTAATGDFLRAAAGDDFLRAGARDDDDVFLLA